MTLNIYNVCNDMYVYAHARTKERTKEGKAESKYVLHEYKTV